MKEKKIQSDSKEYDELIKKLQEEKKAEKKALQKILKGIKQEKNNEPNT